ncbi:MAG: RNA polymerase-binding protein DksA [Xanthomonadales bacterium]|nr:RNA polymerase-binding protein DksA [Xanthomonadales bacterium]
MKAGAAKSVATKVKSAPGKTAAKLAKPSAKKPVAKTVVTAKPKVTGAKVTGKLPKPAVASSKKAAVPIVKVTAKATSKAKSALVTVARKAAAKAAPKPLQKKGVSKPASKVSVAKVQKSKPVAPKATKQAAPARKSSMLGMVKSATRAIAQAVVGGKRSKGPLVVAPKPTPKAVAKPAPAVQAGNAKVVKSATSTLASAPQKLSTKQTEKLSSASKKALPVAPAAAEKPMVASKKASPPVAKTVSSSSGSPNETGNSMKSSGTRSTSSGQPSTTATGGRAVGVKSAKPAAVQAPLTAVKVVRVDLPEGYRPSRSEEYMNPFHLEYFRQKLINWRAELVEESKQTIDNLREEVRDVGDEAERATRETENSLELRTRDRYRKLINKIEKAIKRVDEGEYGYCEETGEEIGLERLEARPIATLCLDAQERYEHRQKMMGD